MQNHHAELFRKLHISSLLDLALLVPAGHNDTTLSRELVLGDILTAEASVKSVQKFGNKLQVLFDLPAFNRKISATFFHVTIGSIAEKAIRHSAKPTFIVPTKP